jgi:DNA-directed RNA polymerase specialized sigma24 family protein
MHEDFKIELKESSVENLKQFSTLLDKEVSVIIEEALERYFAEQQKAILKKELEQESQVTTFEYDEFWDGLDLA